MTKAELRKELRQARHAYIQGIDPATLSTMLKDRFFEKVPLQSDDVVAGYWPIQDEASPIEIMKFLSNMGLLCALPCVEEGGDVLTFRGWSLRDSLTLSKFEVMEPAKEKPTLTPTIIITPVIGFTKAGDRLGQGGGYYDATIAHLKANNPNLRTVGLAYSCQLVDTLPMESHDQKIDMVITPMRVFEN